MPASYQERHIERLECENSELRASSAALLAALKRLAGPNEDYRYRDKYDAWTCVYCDYWLGAHTGHATGGHYPTCPVLDAVAAIAAAEKE